MSRHAQIPNEIVRNEYYDLNANDFCLYVILKFIDYTQKKESKILDVNHKELMMRIGIIDTRTFRRSIYKLYKCGIIKNEIKKIPTKGALRIEFDDSYIKSKGFVKLPISIFNKIHEIGQEGVRLICYYESFINRSADISRQYCFASRDTIAKDLHISKTTLDKYNELLVKNKMLKITKHELKCNNEYDENDQLVFTKYNNHYFVSI